MSHAPNDPASDPLSDPEQLEELLRRLKDTDDLNNSSPEALSAALGGVLGGAGSLGALYGLGVTGLSAAGVTSGLATAGAVVGGGMVAGVMVLAAPVAALAVAGWALTARRKRRRVRELQQALLAELLSRQAQVAQALAGAVSLSAEVIEQLKAQRASLEVLVAQLRLKLKEAEGGARAGAAAP
ncbi:MAG: hypothetical protein FJ138_13635 [Deltaproteobacteria bacterium]|nr:hypothetical protein [Deltaproteobacteria bacterium]